MAKILKDIPPVTKRQVCPNCGQTIEYVAKDLHRYTSEDISGCMDVHVTLTCPDTGCHYVITMNR